MFVFALAFSGTIRMRMLRKNTSRRLLLRVAKCTESGCVEHESGVHDIIDWRYTAPLHQKTVHTAQRMNCREVNKTKLLSVWKKWLSV